MDMLYHFESMELFKWFLSLFKSLLATHNITKGNLTLGVHNFLIPGQRPSIFEKILREPWKELSM